jgi:hypothetical protein
MVKARAEAKAKAKNIRAVIMRFMVWASFVGY